MWFQHPTSTFADRTSRNADHPRTVSLWGALSRAISELIGDFFSGNWPFVDPLKTASFKYSPVEATGQNKHCLNRWLRHFTRESSQKGLKTVAIGCYRSKISRMTKPCNSMHSQAPNLKKTAVQVCSHHARAICAMVKTWYAYHPSYPSHIGNLYNL